MSRRRKGPVTPAAAAASRAATVRLMDDATARPRPDGTPTGVAATHAADLGAICDELAAATVAEAIGPAEAPLVGVSLGWHVGFVRGLQAQCEAEGGVH